MSVIPFRWIRETHSPRTHGVPLTSLQKEMNRLMDTFFTDLSAPESSNSPVAQWSGFAPSIDVSEEDKSFQIEVELPGLEEKDVEVTLNQNILTIKGQKTVERKDSGKNFSRTERSQGSFLRSIPFDVDLDENKVDAQFKNGILKISLPKAPSALKEAKKISIKSA